MQFFYFLEKKSPPRRCPTSVVRVAGEMITQILHALDAAMNRIFPQNESQGHFAWQSEFLFIQEKSKLTLSPQCDVRLPKRAFSSVSYDTMTSMYDTPVRCPASREPSRFSSI
jgi:hypothetical protein